MVRLASISLFDATFSPPTGVKRPMKIPVTHVTLPSAAGNHFFGWKYRTTPLKLRTIPHTEFPKVLRINSLNHFVLNYFL